MNDKCEFTSIAHQRHLVFERATITKSILITMLLNCLGRLLHEEKSAADTDAGFATVEESSVGKKNVERGKYLHI